MGDTKANLFDSADSELDQLLSQAKQDLLARQQEKEATKVQTNSQKPAALTVPIRLNTGSNAHTSTLLKFDEQTGRAQLDIDNIYAQLSSTNASAIDAQIEAKTLCPDPTIKRKTPSQLAKEKESSSGKRWFGMKAPTMTTELKNNLRVLQLRNVLDPKRFYKKDAVAKRKLPKYFEMGTIIEGPTEFYSSRLTKKERRSNLVDELLADKQARSYFKRKVGEIHARNESGGKNWYKSRTRGKAGKASTSKSKKNHK
ncbi:rrna-processing protein fcf2 [Coemansia brasiliensis]|uniref:Rrna-processing protein fcf2 n=1 Tax=Coemansia brasiliensis TaxID=2650707 RepID=A0A9W8IGU2_9FUNG|nr:rrna-processing protein fcf2 [Coemansia brasiliensis]